MRQSTALHATRRNQVSAVVRQAKHHCVDRDADLHDVVADLHAFLVGKGWSVMGATYRKKGRRSLTSR